MVKSSEGQKDFLMSETCYYSCSFSTNYFLRQAVFYKLITVLSSPPGIHVFVVFFHGTKGHLFLKQTKNKLHSMMQELVNYDGEKSNL